MNQEKSKLVLLSAFYDPYMSGAEQMVKEIAERLGDNYDITIVTGRYNKSLPRVEQRDAYRIERVGIGHKQLDKILYIFCAAFKAKKIKPQITHAIMESYAGGALVFLGKIHSKTKRILTLQSGDMDDPKNQKRFIFKLFFKKIHTTPDIVTAISSFLAERAKRYGVADDKVFITPNGVDMSKVPTGIKKENNRVVMVGRLSWEKGHDYLIKAWPAVLERIPEAKLVLVGEGDKRVEIENMVKDLKIVDSVTLTGNLPHDQVLEEISKSEVFVCPSLAEGLGNVFIESQACGVPPIGTRVGGIPDIISDGENGLMIDPKNSQQISEAIVKLLSDKEMIDRFSEKGLETVKKFNWQEIIKKINSIYKEQLSNG